MIELGAGMVVLLPIMLSLLDFSVVTLGAQSNDLTCREAARIAASGDPAEANDRVKAFITQANGRSRGMASNFELVNPGVEFQPANIVQQAQALSDYGGPVQGMVTVHTKVHVSPFLVRIIRPGKPIEFQSVHSFPFTYIVPRTKPLE